MLHFLFWQGGVVTTNSSVQSVQTPEIKIQNYINEIVCKGVSLRSAQDCIYLCMHYFFLSYLTYYKMHNNCFTFVHSSFLYHPSMRLLTHYLIVKLVKKVCTVDWIVLWVLGINMTSKQQREIRRWAESMCQSRCPERVVSCFTNFSKKK